jgi:hypothetical protein
MADPTEWADDARVFALTSLSRQGIVASISGTPSGAGCRRMRSNPGSTGAGSSPATPTSPPRPHARTRPVRHRFDESPLAADEYVISADEKTSIRARIRKHPSTPPTPPRAAWVEHEYARGGALGYLAACTETRYSAAASPLPASTPFDRPVEQVMTSAP